MRKRFCLPYLLGAGVIGGFAVLPNTVTTPTAYAQAKTIKVTGQVVDDLGEPLMGATIKVKGTANGTVTDLDGNFELNVASNGVLEVSFVGFQATEVAINGKTAVGVIKLTNDDKLLEQVVVVGYGTQKKADLTGSVSIVNADEMKRTSNSNISTMLEGKVAGVSITSDGQPGADPSVRIRGIGSFGSTAPLYVIDGVPMGTTIRDFSPNDIETIQVLKDASAGAIYGSRAANGVIIITTKNGAKDQPLKVDYKGYVGVDMISKDVYDVMNADQYSQHLAISCLNSSTPIPGGYKPDANGVYHFIDNTDTDWFKETFKTGIRQNHNVNLSGGGANNTYNIGLDYFSQKGTLEGAGPNYERYTARINNTMETKFIKFRTSVVYSHSNQDGMGMSNANEFVEGYYGGGNTNVLRGTLLMQPTIKAYDESTWCLDDKFGGADKFNYDAYGYGVCYDDLHGDIRVANQLLINKLMQRNTVVDRFVGSGSADVDLLKMIGLENKNHKLTYRLNASYSKTFASDRTFIGSWYQGSNQSIAKEFERLTKNRRIYSDALIENTLTYDGTIGDHHVNLVVGQTYEEENTDVLNAWSINLNEPYFLQLQNAQDTYSESFEYKHAMASYLARLNYDYAGKYLLSAVVRRDGSSRLTKDIRWETFPSVSLGWRLDKENFFPVDRSIINLFKIRASYGVLGNESPVADYAFQATLQRNNMTYNFGNQIVKGSAISTYVNENIAWEKKKSTNVGIDMAFLNNRIEFTAEWYKNVSEDLLYGVPVPANAGVANTSVTMNAASMENSGLEFSVTYRDQTSFGLKYDINANLSTLKNKVTSLGMGNDSYFEGDFATFLGQEVGQFYGYVYKGIARTQSDLDNHKNSKGQQILQQGANVGDCLYEDINNDGVINAEDRVVLGSGMPKVNFGINVHAEYKGFDLSVSTFGALNYHVADNIYNSLNSCYGYDNKDVSMLAANKWSEDGTTYLSNVPRTYIVNGGSLAWNDLFSDRKIQNAAYWKIANVEIGYNFPDKWFGGILSGVRAYVSAQNLCTITGYHGYNVDYATPNPFQPGNNFCSYPSARTFMGGILLSF